MANYEKSWHFDTNRGRLAVTLADMGQYTLWYIKAFLCGQIGGATKGLWSVAGSSDGTTGAMDSSDRWGSSFDVSKIVRNTGSSPHSWVVLATPAFRGTTIYMLLNYNQSFDYSFTMSLTATAPTGGSNTAAPTLTNAGTTVAAPSFSRPSNPGNFHLNAGLATDGSFYVLQSKDNTNLFSSGFVGSWLGNYKQNDRYPFFVHASASISGYGTSNNDMTVTSYSIMLPPDNSVQTNWDYGSVLPAAANLPSAADAFDATFADLPVFIGTSETTIRGLRGRLQDIAFFPGGATTGTVDSRPGAPTYVIVGQYWFPINATPQL